jgi:isopenicillin N synthase-like dioxygenase
MLAEPKEPRGGGTDLMTFDAQPVVADLISAGWAKVRLTSGQADVLTKVLQAAGDFFDRPLDHKHVYSSQDGNHGYRMLGVEYSITPERPDVNESFSLWSDRLNLIPLATELGEFGSLLLAWQEIVATTSAAILTSLARSFDHDGGVAFRMASSVQVNEYSVGPKDRDCLQDRHEDGHIITLVHGTKPGLELFVNDTPTPVDTARDELVVMPGSILSALTGGAVAPLYHQVRNLRLAGRQSIMYFVNPELEHPIHPWVGDRHADLRDDVRDRPNAFGLPDVPMVT